MVSELHEDMLDDVRFDVMALVRKVINDKLYVIVEASVFNSMTGNRVRKTKPLVADCYILAPDGYGTIMVEIGNMKSGKWDNYRWATTQTAIRVLRVYYGGGFAILNPQYTDFERILLAACDEVFNRRAGQGDTASGD